MIWEQKLSQSPRGTITATAITPAAEPNLQIENRTTIPIPTVYISLSLSYSNACNKSPDITQANQSFSPQVLSFSQRFLFGRYIADRDILCRKLLLQQPKRVDLLQQRKRVGEVHHTERKVMELLLLVFIFSDPRRVDMIEIRAQRGVSFLRT